MQVKVSNSFFILLALWTGFLLKQDPIELGLRGDTQDECLHLDECVCDYGLNG